MIKALGHHVLVEVEQAEKQSKGGIYIPDTVRDVEQRAAEIGTIVDVGPTAWLADGLGGSPWAKVGDKVWFAKYGGKWIQEPGSEERNRFLLLIDTDIIARLED